MKIDFVLLWVDGSDPKWLEQYKEYSQEKGDKSVSRFRDWENLRYWFRGVEKFTPWVNKIHFITCGHYPEWLNLDHPKLNFVKHSDYIPSEYLPTFNANVIELNLHRLQDLSEYFVFFNDDFFILDTTSPTYFFKDTKPCDLLVFNAISGGGISHLILNDITLINENFSKRKFVKDNFWKVFNYKYGLKNIRSLLLLSWPRFTGFLDPHLPQPYFKSVFLEVWKKEAQKLNNTCTSRFREATNYNQYLMRYWQLLSGKFHPCDVTKGTQILGIENQTLGEIENIIRSQSKKILVLNDSDNVDFEIARDRIISAFDSILPNKSTYEL